MSALPPADALPPHALDSEQALLGAVILNGEAIDKARQYVQPEDFLEEVHGQIFEAMCVRRDAGEPIDRRMMLAVLGNADLGGTNVNAYLARLVAEATTVVNAPGYARAIAHAARMRKVLATAQEAASAMMDGSIRDPSAHAAHMIEALDEIASAGLAEHARRITLGQGMSGVLDRIDEARAGRVQPGAPFGVPALDRKTLGMRPGQFIVLAGRPGMGKTTAGWPIRSALPVRKPISTRFDLGRATSCRTVSRSQTADTIRMRALSSSASRHALDRR